MSQGIFSNVVAYLFIVCALFVYCFGLFVVYCLFSESDRETLKISSKINVKKIAFGNKEHTTDQKMGVSVLLRFS